MPTSSEASFERYEPYSSLNVVWDPSKPKFELKTPWVNIEVEVELDQEQALREKTEIPNSDFLSNFRDFAIMRIIPRASIEGDNDPLLVNCGSDLLPYVITPRRLAETVAPARAPTLPALPRIWNWDLKPILDRSSIPGTQLYDPLSLYTVLREHYLEDQYKGSPEITLVEKLADLKKRNEKNFFRAMKQILTQTYHITSRCEDALRPALRVHPKLFDPVRRFINAEKGHHLLVLESLTALGQGAPSECDVLAETRLCMEILAFSATHHAMAFCVLVGAFEGDDHAETDPLAALLCESSRPRSARGIHNHFLINKKGNHGAIGEAFVRELGGINRECAETAARLAELLCICQASMSADMISFATTSLEGGE